MAAEFFEFNVGAFNCVAISDGNVWLDMERIQGRFPDVKESDLKKAIKNAGEDPDNVQSHFNTLLIRSGAELILVDAGSGADGPRGTGQLIRNLAEVGVSPSHINHIVITHAHGDHIFGLLTKTGELTFRNARYVISGLEWKYWTSPDMLDSMGDYGKRLRGIFDRINRRTLRIGLSTKIADGITAIPAVGHTPGHIGIKIESKGETFIYLVDILHTTAQFANPDWAIKFDTNPEDAKKTRSRLLQQVADNKTRVMFYHLPAPGIGTVTAGKKGTFEWNPIDLDEEKPPVKKEAEPEPAQPEPEEPEVTVEDEVPEEPAPAESEVKDEEEKQSEEPQAEEDVEEETTAEEGDEEPAAPEDSEEAGNDGDEPSEETAPEEDQEAESTDDAPDEDTEKKDE